MDRTSVLKISTLFILFSTLACKQAEEFTTAANMNSLSALSEKVQEDSLDGAVQSLESAILDAAPSVDEIELNVIEDEVPEQEPEEDVAEPVDDLLDYPICPAPAFKQDCRSNGVISAQKQKYDRCLVEGTQTIMSGWVRLLYNNPGCSLAEDGFSVHRSHKLIRLHRPSGKISKITSARQTNFKRQTVGGGEILANKEQGWRLSFTGVNLDVKKEGRKILDVASRTPRPIRIFDKREEGAVFVHGGVLSIDHNLAQFTARYAPKKLKFTGDCKCPVSGELLFGYFGSKQGRGVAKFLGCGQVLIKRQNGHSREIRIERCLKEDSDGTDHTHVEEPADLEPVSESILAL